MQRESLAVRAAVGAVVGFGFVPSTVAATLGFAGAADPIAVGAGALAGLGAFAWIVRTGELR